MLPKGVDVSGSVLERGLDRSLKSSRNELKTGGLQEFCEHTGRVEFEIVLLEICVT